MFLKLLVYLPHEKIKQEIKNNKKSNINHKIELTNRALKNTKNKIIIKKPMQ